MLLLHNGRVIDPSTRTDAVLDVAVDGGRIVAIGKALAKPAGATVVRCEGRIVAPGLIDPHVHLREPGQEHKETIATGTFAAVAGGFTSVCCMPNTSPALDTPELVRFVIDRAASVGKCRVFPVAAATRARRGEELTETGLIARAGAAGFSDDGDCIASAGTMARALGAAKQADLCLMQHAQDPTLTRGGVMHNGPLATRLGLGGWPRIAEEIIVERDIRLNRAIGCDYHVQHISSADTVDLIRRARRAGQPVTGEASPHHLVLTCDACDNYNTLGKVNPPLRETSDIKALREGIADGSITVLGTDHAPHSADEKALPFEEAPFGFVGLETAIPLYVEALISTGAIEWPRLIELMTTEPAKLCRLDRRGLGRLAVGGPADITVIDPDISWNIRAADMHGLSRNMPFEGRSVRGRAVATIVAGEIRWLSRAGD